MMTPVEELRYLILALQREGNRLLAAGLRGLELTPSQAETLRVLADHQPLSPIRPGRARPRGREDHRESGG